MTLKKQSQFELFPSNETELRSADSKAHLFKDLTLTPENIIVIAIVFLMILVVSFSFGVEKGRRIVLASLEKETVAVVTPPAPVVAQAPQATVVPVNTTTVVSTVKTAEAAPQVVAQPLQERKPILPKPAEKVPEVKEKESVGGPYTVQVASFKSKQQAQREASILKSKGYDIFVLSKGSYTIVCVGKFSRQDQAKRIINELKGRYNDCLVRRL